MSPFLPRRGGGETLSVTREATGLFIVRTEELRESTGGLETGNVKGRVSARPPDSQQHFYRDTNCDPPLFCVTHASKTQRRALIDEDMCSLPGCLRGASGPYTFLGGGRHYPPTRPHNLGKRHFPKRKWGL